MVSSVPVRNRRALPADPAAYPSGGNYHWMEFQWTTGDPLVDIRPQLTDGMSSPQTYAAASGIELYEQCFSAEDDYVNTSAIEATATIVFEWTHAPPRTTFE